MSHSANSSSTAKEAARPIYLWPKGADLSAVKAAVSEAGLPFKVRPFWFEPGVHRSCIVIPGADAAPALPIGPDYVVPRTPNAAVAAVRWFFGMQELPVVHTALSGLQAVFGDGVREVEPGPLDCKPDMKGGWVWPDDLPY